MSRSLLIVGGGVVGLSTAYYALQHGFQVTLLERGSRDHDGCSLGNAGMIVPSHFVPLAAPGVPTAGLRMLLNRESPFGIRLRPDPNLVRWIWLFVRACRADRVRRAAPVLRDLHLCSRTCYQEFAAIPGAHFGLETRGLLMLCKTAHGFEEEVRLAEMARSLNLPGEVLTPEDAARLDPGLRMTIAGAVYYPQDCHLVPHRFIEWLIQFLQEQGVRFCWSSRVTGWRVGDRGIQAVRTTGGEFSAEEYVIAAGSWTAQVAQGLGLDLPLQAGKGYSQTLPGPRRLPGIASILTEARVAVTPMDGDLRFAGTLEICGLDESVSRARVRGMQKSVAGYYPELRPAAFEGFPVWHGMRPCSPDGLPYVGRPRRYSNLCIAAGHAMMGLSLGPITGKLVAEILSGEPASVSLELLNPDRYAR